MKINERKTGKLKKKMLCPRLWKVKISLIINLDEAEEVRSPSY